MENYTKKEKYLGELPITFNNSNGLTLVKAFDDVSELEGVLYLDKDICITAEKINNYLLVKTLADLIKTGDANIVIKSDNSGHVEYFMRLLNEIKNK